MLVSSLTAFTLGQALLSRKHLNASLSDPAALRSIVGAALYLTVAAITALALGALLRNTAAAISAFVAVFFVIPPLAPSCPLRGRAISSSTCHPTPARRCCTAPPASPTRCHPGPDSR
jgi:hypothetical protein